MRLLLEVDSTATRDHLAQMRGRLENGRSLMGRCGLLLEDYEREVFATRGRGRWAPDDPLTIERKAGGRVLVDTGGLLDELTTAHVDSDDSVVVNQGDAYYARFLRDGDRGMPRRDPAPEPPASTRREWADRLLGYIVDGSW